jgi:HPt (histidine-containing phosphotransfer) domain-containing protein
VEAKPFTLAARALSLRWPLIAVAAIGIAALAHVHAQREQVVRALHAAATGIAAGTAEALDSQLRGIDQTLLYVRALHARDRETLDLEPWVNSAELAQGRAWPVAIANADGLLIFADLRRILNRVDVSSLQPFRHFARITPGPADDHLFIGAPVRPGRDQHSTIQFARPLMTPLGGFDGIVILTVDAQALLPASAYANAVLSVVGEDSVIRASRDDAADSRKARRPDAGWITGTRRVGGYPLLVEAAVPDDPTAIGLREDGAIVSAAAMVLSIGILFAAFRRPRTSPVHAPNANGSLSPQAGQDDANVLQHDPPPTAAVAPIPATSQPALDHLMDIMGTGAVAGIVASFQGELPRQLDRMHALASDGDCETLLREARSLASSAAAIGLDQLAAAAGELEADACHHAPNAIAARLDRIDLLARRATDRLEAYLLARAA